MIIRRLREDEGIKLDSIQSLAFSFPFDRDKSDGHGMNSEVYGSYLDDGETLTATIFTPSFKSYYHGTVLGAMGIGGVASVPEYRRGGSIREIFNHIFAMAPERNWAISYLYPFSFAFYRQFGYERVIKRHGLHISGPALDKFPRNTNAKLYQRDGEVKKEDLLSVYNTWAAKNNLVFARDMNTHYWSEKQHNSQKFTYLWYDEAGVPSALATISCKSGTMTIPEICYVSPEALRSMIGFLRMFDGQVSTYNFTELPENSELELMLGRYCEIGYHEENGAMGRVLLPGTLLEANRYPMEHGHFRLQIDDFLDFSRGVWDVEYENGKALVRRDPFDSAYDVSMTAAPMSRLLLGAEILDADRAQYLEGVKIENRAGAADLFRAFPKCPGVIYERF
ncbi:MAG: GNAT family N-acetyltransferase [Clostridia bacterium]|nr:GNAT family N-acetyltransferase [Clostridia bacterium]